MGVDVGTFSKSAFIITTENSSLPKKLPEGVKLIAGPFTITVSAPVDLKRILPVSFNNVTGVNLQILQFSTGETNWKSLETQTDSVTTTATATTSTFGTFVLVKKI